MIKKCTILYLCFLIVVISASAQTTVASSKDSGNIFHVVHPDYTLSPYTGMMRQHWKDAAMYLLKGAFSYIHTLDDPMLFPKQPGKSYPRSEVQIPTAKLEGLCRTLFVAAPLLKEDSALTINHIKVADYYRYQLQKLVDSNSATFIQHRAPNGGPSQILVEFGGLSVSLFTIPDILWDPLPQTSKDALAATMISYGDGPTVPSNWKFFNIFVLSFYKGKGYTVNDQLLEEYLQKTLAHYRGDSWYNDNPAYDYYSMWAFQMYGMLWSHFFGDQYYPKYAAQFKQNFAPLKNNYPYLFGRDGKMIMWGRSISYRFAATIPLALTGLEKSDSTNYGWMRRIASGALLQFLQNPEFLKDNIPTLGFYGAFEPAVQSYSCRGSVYWMGKAFLSLLLPADNPYWTAKENEGPWQTTFKKNQVYNKLEDSAHILITDYPNSGIAEIRAWCHVPVIGAGEPFRGSENYNRLSYNSAFPWQADSSNGTVAMNYVFKNKKGEWEPLRLFTFKQFNNGIYYRDAVLETDTAIRLNLADIPLPNGILRVDRNLSQEDVAARLGHYALPQINGSIKEEKREVKGYKVTIIDNGIYQLAMIPLMGWKNTEVVHAKGLNPVNESSSVIDVSATFVNGQQHPIYATLMLWKRSGEQWKADELMPVKKMEYSTATNIVTIVFSNGETKLVKYDAALFQ